MDLEDGAGNVQPPKSNHRPPLRNALPGAILLTLGIAFIEWLQGHPLKLILLTAVVVFTVMFGLHYYFDHWRWRR